MEDLNEGVVVRKIVRVTGADWGDVDDPVVEEVPLTIYLNGQELATFLCSPYEEEYLVLGFLTSEGMVEGLHEIKECTVDRDRGLAWVETTVVRPVGEKMFLKRCLTACCGKGRVGFYFANDAKMTQHIESQMQIGRKEIICYQQALEEASGVFQATGGVHGGALAAEGELIHFSQDIGRHNVFDKLYGYCLSHNISPAEKIIVFTGRVSSEIVLKLSKMGIPIIIARSAPTSLGLDLAKDLGITVVGFARGERFNIYTCPERVQLKG